MFEDHAGSKIYEFVVFFGLIVIFIVVVSLLAAYPEAFLNTPLGKWRAKNTSPRQIRMFSLLCLCVLLSFLCASFVQLAKGTFKWKGSPKTYSFSDFLK